ncbi:MAG: DUF885 family protein, partial [Vicinamibacterales bacterium]
MDLAWQAIINFMRLCALLTLLPLVSLVGCAVQAPDSDGTSERWRSALDEDWKYWMAEYPELATSLGYPGHNARWTDYSPNAIAARADYLKRSVQRLAGVDRTSLQPADQLSYDLYLDLLQTAIAGLEFHNDALPIRGVIPHNLRMPLNQLEGVALDVPRTIALMPKATRTDYENIVARLRSVDVLVDQTLALMEQGLADGLTPPRITVRDVPAQVQAQLVDDPARSPLLEAFREWPAALPEDDRADLAARAADAYRQHVRPAFEKLHQFLVSRYLPACREAVSVGALPGGAAMYRYNVEWHVTTGETPQQIHETGLAELKRIREQMGAIRAS